MTAPNTIQVPPGMVVDGPELTCQVCFAGPFRTLRGASGHAWKAHQLRADAYWERFGPKAICPRCGKKRTAGKARSRMWKRQFCSWQCSNRAKFKGRHVTVHGYATVNLETLNPTDLAIAKPMATSQNGLSVLEHRLVMARYLGRTLKPFEQVHHRNGKRADNRLENLELRVGPHGAGATATAILCPHCGKSYA